MAKPRRPQYNILGQEADFNIQGSKYNIRRQRDRFFVHGKRVRRGNIGVQGSTTHLHVHTGRRRMPVPEQKIDFEGQKRRVEEMIAERQKEIAKLLGEPVPTSEFAKTLHPVRDVVGRNPKGKTWFKRWATWLHPKQSWFVHLPRTANKLLPVSIGMGIGRPSKRAQLRAYRRDLNKTSGEFNRLEVQRNATELLATFTNRINSALTEYRADRDGLKFERALNDAQKSFRDGISGTSGLIPTYGKATGRNIKNI